ncbi:DUF6214 family protein [Streptomyces sp. NPDC060064]|uniref:DUF6214 family protein n=1 Tax=Streptomyces sp. NPDC060064 TaxID=3347049 RepID=UPI00368E920E
MPYPPVWELQGRGTVTCGTDSLHEACEVAPPWFNVRLTFADGARLDVLAVVTDGRIAIEEWRADPPLPLEGFAVLADRLRDPLEDACRVAMEQPGAEEAAPVAPGDTGRADAPSPDRRRARSAVPRGSALRRIAADVYRAAQQDGRDPVLAVMGATGRSRRRSLRLIAGARDEGYLAPRHNRRRADPAPMPDPVRVSDPQGVSDPEDGPDAVDGPNAVDGPDGVEVPLTSNASG